MITREEIVKIQKTLGLVPDGIWGPKTSASVMDRITASQDKACTNDRLAEQLLRDEGFVPYAYRDSLGYFTIGVGRLIDKNKGGGITREEALHLLENDIAKVDKQLREKLPWTANLSEARRGVLLNMAFQLGINGLLGFKNTLAMIERGEYVKAADGMLNSLWAKQTPVRAKRLSEQMRTDKWL